MSLILLVMMGGLRDSLDLRSLKMDMAIWAGISIYTRVLYYLAMVGAFKQDTCRLKYCDGLG
jgi:hypothetical protein